MRKLICLVLVLIFMPACSNNLNTKDLFYLKNKDDAYYLVSQDGKINSKIQTDKRVKGIKILPDSKSFIIDVLNSRGVNIDSNGLLFMLVNGKTANITKEYAAENPKISPDGLKIAYTSYTSDDLNSYQGIFLSDTKGNKQKINTTKRVTQGLYEWLDNKNVIFYGIDIETRDLSKIYLYNIDSKKESILYDGIIGYCSFFSANNKNNILVLDEGIASDRDMKIVDLKNKTTKKIQFIYDTIYDCSISEDGNYAAITARETSEDKPHVFIYNFKSNKIEIGLTDYPDEVTTSRGYLVWDSSKLYYSGKSGDKYSVYSMDIISKEIKKVSDESENCLYPQKVQN